MSQQSRLPLRPTQRLTIERLISFLRGQPAPPPPPPVTPQPKGIPAPLTHADVAAEAPHRPNRETVERMIGHFRAPATTSPLDPAVLRNSPPSPMPISHAPFLPSNGEPPAPKPERLSPAPSFSAEMEHDPPTLPVKPERLTRAIASRPSLAAFNQLESFPDGCLLMLRAIGGQQLGTLTLAKDVLLGRAAAKPDTELRADRINLSALVPDTSSISRIHAMLRLTDNRRVQVVDMGSTNGTYVNRQRLDSFKPTLIKDGDEIQLGIFRLRVHFLYP